MINTTKHIKPFNKQVCSPHGYWSAGQVESLNLNIQKTQINDAEWRMAA